MDFYDLYDGMYTEVRSCEVCGSRPVQTEREVYCDACGWSMTR